MRPQKRKRGENRKKRKNPAAGFLPVSAMKDMAGRIALDGVLAGCSFEERVILATLLPELLRIIRQTGLPDPKSFPAVNIDITGTGPIISITRPETPVRAETDERTKAE